ncbi:MAG TPA: hypothetical protein VNW95_10665 [Mucilaginibacter sp.]|jgi:hypothetical protein|nr:hypothetical protein [Mucilaginibacter sp.]
MISAINTSPFHLIFTRKLNTWYSIKDGSWSDPNTWMSNALDKKLTLYPQPGDNVYIHHNVNLDMDNQSVTGLYGGGMLVFGFVNRTFTINSVLNMSGGMDMSSAIHNLILNGYTNSAGNFIGGTNGTVVYNGTFDQAIMQATYCNLIITGTGKKYLQSSISTTGSLKVNGVGFFELGNYNLTIGGQTIITGAITSLPATLSKTGSGTVLFVGLFTLANNPSAVNFTGNPTLEFQGGIAFKNDAIATNFGTGTLNFTTNNQTLSLSNGGSNPVSATAYIHVTNSVVNIVGAITVTSNAQWLVFDGVVNGTLSSSTLTNNGHLLFGNSALSMTTGIFNYNTPGTSLGYIFNGDFTLPYTSYQQLIIEGTGTKTPPSSGTWTDLYIGIKNVGGFNLSANTSVSGNIYIRSGKLECGTYNLSVTGTTSLNASTSIFSKTGAGSLLFTGTLNNFVGGGTIAFTGNPTIELQGGLYMKRDGFYNFGTGDMSFTTNNQTVQSENATYPDSSFKTAVGNIIISGPITITYSSSMWIVNGTLNGTTVASTFVNTGYLQYKSAQQPMQTGVFSTNSVINYFEYGLNGDQDITPGTYRYLILSAGGSKKLLGNVSVINTYNLNSPATLNSNGFALTNP